MNVSSTKLELHWQFPFQLGLFPIPPITIFCNVFPFQWDSHRNSHSHSRAHLYNKTLKEVSTNVTGAQSNLAKGHITTPYSDEWTHLLHALATTEPLQTSVERTWTHI